MSHGKRLLVTRALFVFLAIWTVSTAVVYAKQRYSGNATAASTELMILREQIANATALASVQAANFAAIAAIDKRLAVVEQTNGDALTEVREMRKMIYGIAATLLISLLMQVAQIKKGRREA